MSTVTTMADKMIRSASRALAGSRLTRRSFFARTAVLGSALTIDPVGFATKPVSAYAAVCGDAANCSDGFSVFCCTITKGGNFCPDGTFLAGWWKADNSGFCCGGPRYYLDCNAVCGSGWSCHCEDSPDTCDHRHISCNQFRYGQCHTEIACYGPVVCRLVTCTPPWAFDPSCTSSSASDQSTVSHTAPCLPGDCPSDLVLRWYDLGGPAGFLGAQAASDRPIAGGSWLELTDGAIFKNQAQGIHYTQGHLFSVMKRLGGPQKTGVPTQDDASCSDGIGRYNVLVRMKGATAVLTSVYWSPVAGSGSVKGLIRDHWVAANFENGRYGYPTTDTLLTSDGTSRYVKFAKVVDAKVASRGAIYSSPVAGTWGVHGAIFKHFKTLGYENGALGYPTSDVHRTTDGEGHLATFAKVTDGSIVDRAVIYSHPVTGTFSVHGAVLTAWQTSGAEAGPLGYPTSDQRRTTDRAAVYNTFATVVSGAVRRPGAIYAHPTFGTRAVSGSILKSWSGLNGEAGALGYPTADEASGSVGAVAYRSQDFEHGVIVTSSVGRGATMWGSLAAAYATSGGPAGPYGLPLGSQVDVAGSWSCDFQGGNLTVSA
ncbi:MAG: hypothetical protein WCI12_08835 [Actinomycetes bacterium]